MLGAVPKSIFSWCFGVYDDEDLLVDIDMAWFREGGNFDHGDHRYTLRKAGMLSGEFSLEADGEVIAAATKRAMVRYFSVRCGSGEYVLRAVSPFTRRFVVERNGIAVGGIGPEHPFTRRSNIDLPEEIDIAEEIFMFWLVILMWKRAAQSD